MAAPLSTVSVVVSAGDCDRDREQHDADAEWLALRLTFQSSTDMMRVRTDAHGSRSLHRLTDCPGAVAVAGSAGTRP
jgi:hypothetical protein